MHMNETAAVDGLLPDCSGKLEKRDYSKVVFCDFVLWSFDCNLASSFSSKVVLSGTTEQNITL